tara:strand:- start:798 stop:2441 length:1644 start_codon:yes stop_codon:yes gene_type:complete
MEKYPGPYVVSHKIDGISAMWYRGKDGKIKLYTRGNGVKGQNISGILKYINVGNINIPSKFNKKEIVVRGELIMSKKIWEKYYADDNPNVRNLVSGVAGAKHPDPADMRRVEMIAYQLMIPRMKPSDQLANLTEWGFNVVHNVREPTLNEPLLQVKLEQARTEGEYQIDGLVISQDKLNDLSVDNPKHSIAFKMLSEEIAQTRVLEVVWRASKRYLLKPTVMIEPVFLSGGNLTKATGHNAKYVQDNAIGPGALVTIVRSGEVIPFIVQVNEPSPSGPDMPKLNYKWTEGGFDVKISEMTSEVSHSILLHMSKTLEIKNLGPGVITKVIESGFTTPAEVLNMNLDDWKQLPSLGKNSEKIWNSLQKVLIEDGIWISQLMDATSIFGSGLGQKKMQLVLDKYPDLLDMEEQYSRADLVKKLVSIKGIQTKTAEKIIDGLPEFKDFLDLVPQIVLKDDASEDSESESEDGIDLPDLDGVRVVFTGVRDKNLEAWIKRAGGDVATGVSKTHNNQYVIAKDPNAGSNKLKSAKEYGATVLGLDDFKKKFGY